MVETGPPGYIPNIFPRFAFYSIDNKTIKEICAYSEIEEEAKERIMYSDRSP